MLHNQRLMLMSDISDPHASNPASLLFRNPFKL